MEKGYLDIPSPSANLKRIPKDKQKLLSLINDAMDEAVQKKTEYFVVKSKDLTLYEKMIVKKNLEIKGYICIDMGNDGIVTRVKNETGKSFDISLCDKTLEDFRNDPEMKKLFGNFQ